MKAASAEVSRKSLRADQRRRRSHRALSSSESLKASNSSSQIDRRNDLEIKELYRSAILLGDYVDTPLNVTHTRHGRHRNYFGIATVHVLRVVPA